MSLNISDCKKIEEIIGHVGEEVKKICISFSELKLLKLSYLTRLTSFCFENYTLEFPSLERVSMIHCPNMKTFSQGFLRTPKLCKVQVTKKEEDELRHWEGNLNSTVRKCYKEMACVNQLSPLHLHIFIYIFFHFFFFFFRYCKYYSNMKTFSHGVLCTPTKQRISQGILYRPKLSKAKAQVIEKEEDELCYW